MRLLALMVMLLAMTILHPGIALAAAILVYLTAGKRRREVPKAMRIAPVARIPPRAEAIAQRFGRIG